MCLGVGCSRGKDHRACQDCQDCTLDCGDFYAKKIDLALPSGRTHYRTCAGACISFCVVLIAIMMIVLGINEMLDDNSFVLQEAVVKDWYDETELFPFGEDDHNGSL